MLRSARYMAYVRRQSCCACSLPGPSDPHHAATGGRGIKADDYTCIPLCRQCHNVWHSHRQFAGIMRSENQLFILKTQLRLMKTYTYTMENRDHGSEKEIGEPPKEAQGPQGSEAAQGPKVAEG